MFYSPCLDVWFALANVDLVESFVRRVRIEAG